VNSKALEYEADTTAGKNRLAAFITTDFIGELFYESYARRLDETCLTNE
jgi:hypothetical protein